MVKVIIQHYTTSSFACYVPQVADSKGHTLFRKEDASKGKFAFTTEDYDMFEVCFYSTATCELNLGLKQPQPILKL